MLASGFSARNSLPPRNPAHPQRFRLSSALVPRAWCPGLDVPPKRHDITDQVQIGGDSNVISYFGGFRGQPYTPVRAPGVEPGAGWDMRIEMKSFLLYWTEP